MVGVRDRQTTEGRLIRPADYDAFHADTDRGAAGDVFTGQRDLGAGDNALRGRTARRKEPARRGALIGLPGELAINVRGESTFDPPGDRNAVIPERPIEALDRTHRLSETVRQEMVREDLKPGRAGNGAGRASAGAAGDPETLAGEV